MGKVKMIKIEDGSYVPQECCWFAENSETGKQELDKIDMPCGADCDGQCQNCVIQKIMNEYAELEEKEDDWIPVTKRMPEEHDSVFAKCMKKISHYVIATVLYKDGTRLSERAHTIDGKWKTELSVLNGTVIAWKEFPEPYKGE